MEPVLEEIAKRTLVVIHQTIDDALYWANLRMQNVDTEFFMEFGQAVPTTVLTAPADDAYYAGDAPSLIDRDVSLFPVIVANATQSYASAQNSGDTVERLEHLLRLDAFVLDADIANVNRMTWRYAKALHEILTRNPDLDGMVEKIDTAPRVVISEAARRVTSGTDQTIVYVQGCRLETPVRITKRW